MTELEIFEKLKEIFKLVVNSETDLSVVTMDSNIVKDLGMSSIALVYLIVGIEEMFDVDMSDVSFNTFENVGDVVKYIKESI